MGKKKTYITIQGQVIVSRSWLVRMWRHVCRGIVQLGREQLLIDQQAAQWKQAPPCCPSCLSILPVNGKFCSECGARVVSGERHTDRIPTQPRARKTITDMIQQQGGPRRKLFQWYNGVAKTRKVIEP